MKPGTKRPRRKRKEEDSVALAFIDALADVIAGRVVAQLEASKHPPAMPARVPLWVSDPRHVREKEPPEIEDDWTPEKVLRSIGLIKHGEPGYAEGLAAHLARQRAQESDVEARARMRKAVRLLEKLLGPSRMEQ